MAAKIGIDPDLFESSYNNFSAQITEDHINDSRRLLAKAGAQGFPTALLEDPNGEYTNLNIGHFYGQTNKWLEHLTNSINKPLEYV